MRICSKDIRLIRLGELKNEQRNDEPKKKNAKPVTAAHKRKIEALKKHVEADNRAKLNAIIKGLPAGAEVRG